MGHSTGEEGSILLTAEVEPPHLPRVPPLVEVGRGLIVLQALHNRTVNHHLLICLHLASHHSEGVSGGVVVDLDPAESLRPCSCREPHLIPIIIDHHRGPSLADTGLTHCWARIEILSDAVFRLQI